MTSAMTLCMHVARNVKGEPEFYTGTFFLGGEYTAQTPTTYYFPKLERCVWITDRQTNKRGRAGENTYLLLCRSLGGNNKATCKCQ